MGILPDQFWSLTFFELASYSRSLVNKDKILWNHTSTVMSLIANANRDPKRKPTPYSPQDFNPYKDEDENSEQNEITEEQINSIASWHVNPSSP